MSTKEDERFWQETERMLSGLDAVREKRDPFWEQTERLLERHEHQAWEKRADRVEEASVGWEDELTGFPLPGFESPRFLTEQQRAYKAWYRGSSPQAARARSIREGGRNAPPPSRVDRHARHQPAGRLLRVAAPLPRNVHRRGPPFQGGRRCLGGQSARPSGPQRISGRISAHPERMNEWLRRSQIPSRNPRSNG
jgi:hypothetical protein